MAITPSAAVPREDIARAEEVKRADRDLTGKLLKFAEQKHPDWISRGIAEVAERSGPVTRDELQLIIPWVLFFYRPPGTRLTLAERFIDKEARRLNVAELGVLIAQQNAWLSPCAVESVERGVGITVHDRFTDQHTFLYEMAGSETAQPGTTFLVRVVRVGDIAFVSGMHPQPLRNEQAFPILDSARKYARVRTRPISPEILGDDEFQMWLIDNWRQFVEEAGRPPELRNTDGDPFEMTVDHFDFSASDRDEVIIRLSAIPGAQAPQMENDGRLAIVVLASGRGGSRGGDRGARSGASGDTVIGSIRLAAERLEVDTNSTRRADHLAAEVKKRCGALVRQRLRSTTDTPTMLTEAMSRAQSSGPSSGSRRAALERPAMGAEGMTIVRQMKQQHYTAWLDDKIPMLGGRTPREAARGGKAVREKLEELLQLIERGEASLPEVERFDVTWLREQLRV